MSVIAEQFEAHAVALRRYFKENAGFVVFLSLLALAAYGFELFNLNLTIDEEARAFRPDDGRFIYISHGRWGLFLLDKFLLPFPVIAFVPLFLALACHVGAVLIFLQCWDVESAMDRLAAGALGVAYPGMAYFYAFSISNYAIGIGLLCAACSLYIFTRAEGRGRLVAVIPAVFALSIYQAFAVVLAAAYLVSIISSALRNERLTLDFRNMAEMLLVGVVTLAVYFFMNAVFLEVAGVATAYVDEILSFSHIRNAPTFTTIRTLATASQVYGGSASIYANSIHVFGLVIALAFGGLLAAALRTSLGVAQRLFICLLGVLLLLMPFVVGIFTGGNIPVRFMVALPVVVSGVTVLGMRLKGRGFRLIIGACIFYCVFQFVVSINYLNSSSHLALQADRLLASHVISRIEEARTAAGLKKLKYLEVVGYRRSPASALMPKAETFGASFFEWDQGHASRIIVFIRTLGYYNEVEAMPAERRGQVVGVASAMPEWPAAGSVKIDDDAVIIKFGDYSALQKKSICEKTQKPAFCR
jgi:hypothetical protein